MRYKEQKKKEKRKAEKRQREEKKENILAIICYFKEAL